jgi:hypothetical protein
LFESQSLDCPEDAAERLFSAEQIFNSLRDEDMSRFQYVFDFPSLGLL